MYSCVWLFLFSIFFRFIHVVVSIQSLFLFIGEEYCTVWICYKMFICLSVDMILDYLQFEAIMSKAAVNNCVHSPGLETPALSLKT